MVVFKVHEWKFPITFPGTIIDIETSDFKEKGGEIITFGYFSSDLIKIFQRIDFTEKGREEFEKFVNASFNFLPRPYYAYNSEFEEKFLPIKFDHDLFKKWSTFAERCHKCEEHGLFLTSSPEEKECPICKKSIWVRIKWPKLEELIGMPHNYYGIETEAPGKEIPEIWKKYKETKDEKILLRTVYHNLYDLIRSACLILWDETILGLIADTLKLEESKPRTLKDETDKK